MKVILVGAAGRMGGQMLALLQSLQNVEIVAVDEKYPSGDLTSFDSKNSDFSTDAIGCSEQHNGCNEQNDGCDEKNDRFYSRHSGCKKTVCGIKQCKNIRDVHESADVIVDFSLHTAAREVAEFAVERNVPLVVATTGHTPLERAYIERASNQIPVFMASNMSLAMAHLKAFAARLAVAFPDADIEIVEAHHSNKLDAPSGTALSVANAIVKQRGFGKVVVGRGEKRERGEINVHSLRIGASLGEHTVIVDTKNERIILAHQTFSRAVYAEGALLAVRFVLSRPVGLYGISDLLGEF